VIKDSPGSSPSAIFSKFSLSVDRNSSIFSTIPFFNQLTLKKAQDELTTVMVEKILELRSTLRENFEKIADGR
jgi:hypothetical protein